ncbi:MAG: hypothetical protein ACK49G_07165, partial [Brevundimonas sp.]
MSRYLSLKRLGILFLGLFALSVTATLVFQSYWVEPGERCEAGGGWWDLESRTCARPIYIPDITGRRLLLRPHLTLQRQQLAIAGVRGLG